MVYMAIKYLNAVYVQSECKVSVLIGMYVLILYVCIKSGILPSSLKNTKGVDNPVSYWNYIN